MEDVDIILALKYVAVTWIDTPDIESKIKQYYEKEVSHNERSLSFWFSNVREEEEEEKEKDEEEEDDGDNDDGDGEDEEMSNSESEWESTTSVEVTALADTFVEFSKVDISQINLPVTDADNSLYTKMQEISTEWDTWCPRDDISQILKNAVQASIDRYSKTQ